MNLSNVTNAGFYFLNLNTVASEMIKLSYCSNLDFYNCSIINVMGSNLIENSTNIYFENCKIKGGTYPNPTKCSCKISDVVPNTEHYIIFENCIFDYSSGSAWDTVIDGSGITNSKCRITLINCLNPSGSFITAADITKGSGQWYALTPSAL